MLKDNYDYFVSHHDDLYKKYPNKYIIIQNLQVVAAEDSMKKAVEYADSHNFKSGDYIIQYCSIGNSAYTSSFCSQIIYE